MAQVLRVFAVCLLGSMVVLFSGCDMPGIEPMKPGEPVEPTEPVDPVEPTDPVEPVEPTEPTERVVCMNGAPAADNPLLCERGYYALPGIDTIPLNLVTMTNKQMQEMFVLVDYWERHADSMADGACRSYITQTHAGFADCRRDDPNDRAGKVRHKDGTVVSGTGPEPFTMLLDQYPGPDDGRYLRWLYPIIRDMGTVKIIAHTIGFGGADSARSIGDGNYPHLVVNSAGNDQTNAPLLDITRPEDKVIVYRAIAAHKLLVVAGWDRDGNGNYIRHHNSSSCLSVDDGCLWVQYDFRLIGRGTSLSTQQVAAGLASVLSVFPDTGHQDLAKLAKLCAKKTGDGIETLLSVSGGTGVADFSCMGPITRALQQLPAGGMQKVPVNGGVVAVSKRMLVVE